MPASHYIDKKLKILVSTWEGDATDSECIEALKKYQEEFQNNPEYIKYNEIIDTRKVKKIKLTTKGIKYSSQLASSTDRNEKNRKLAFIVNSNLAYGLVRMFIAYRSFSDNASKEINVFKNEKKAIEWVKNNT